MTTIIKYLLLLTHMLIISTKRCKLTLLSENNNIIKTYKVYINKNINTKASLCLDSDRSGFQKCLADNPFALIFTKDVLLTDLVNPYTQLKDYTNFAFLLKYTKDNDYVFPSDNEGILDSTYAVINNRDFEELRSFFIFSYMKEYTIINCKFLYH
jgi:hypothetical protein